MGSGSLEYEEIAAPLGRWLAEIEVHLLTGGGPGVMASVSRSFAGVANRKGRVIGVIPGIIEHGKVVQKHGYPNPWVEIPVYTHLPLSGAEGTENQSRNHINILTSDVIVALPGGAGTASEIALAVNYQKPIIVYSDANTKSTILPESVVRAHSLSDIKKFVLQSIRIYRM
ncbi:MAG: molybdenum cofactor carrier protein [Calditrichaeota bacterium]|nr:MAG: molybdenum cofactor carrier protein [Calditrichota bacterium]